MQPSKGGSVQDLPFNASTGVIGREAELAALRAFLADEEAARSVFVLTGEPGIGKTTLWEACVDLARLQGFRVMSARPSEAESRLSFAAITDLLDGIEEDVLAAIPAPQIRALEVALLRKEPSGRAPEPRATATGFLHVLRALAARDRVLIAVDDAPWLDRSSSDVLCFAARRLRGRAPRFLLARRPGEPPPLEQAFPQQAVDRLAVRPLSLGGTRVLLAQRLGLSVSRRVLRRIVETGQGNPLLTLELGRTIQERGVPQIGSELPLPQFAEDLFGARLAAASRPVRRLLLAIALSGDLARSELASISAPKAIDDAVDDGLLAVEGERARASHPLFAAAAKAGSTSRERRGLHAELARVLGNEARRLHHRALATESPDVELAASLTNAAQDAAARGRPEEAVELVEDALRLTPTGDPSRADRLFALAHHLDRAGEIPRLRDLLMKMLSEVPPGVARGEVHLLLADAADSFAQSDAHLGRALEESEDDSALRAAVLARRSLDFTTGRAERLDDAEAWLDEARRAVRGSESHVEQFVDYATGWTRLLRGRPIDDLRARDESSAIFESLDRVAALRLTFRGQVDESRRILHRLSSAADERGETWSHFVLRCQLCELELRAGNAEVAAKILEEWEVYSEEDVIPQQMRARYEAHLAALRGVPNQVEPWVLEAIARSAASGVRWDALEAVRARGIAALLAGEPDRAVESLGAVWDHTQSEGVGDPGAFPVAPDFVEALVDVGDAAQARTVTERLRVLAERQEHPWGLASVARCDVLVRFTSKREESSGLIMDEAVDAYEELGLRFDAGRSLLAVGRWRRRSKKWGAAREALQRADVLFDELGCGGWAAAARSELERVAARRPRPTGELTPSERRVAQLAAEGLGNKEIARKLFITVHTVEAHLSHAYAKLGIRSRSQLAESLRVSAI